MFTPYIGDIRLFAGNFAPRGWAFCNGQLLSIGQYKTLFSILGTIYGGDGETTFALPNLQGLAPLGWGQKPGLSNYQLGQSGGETTVTLTVAQIPQHKHAVNGKPAPGDTTDPAGAIWAVPSIIRGTMAYNADPGDCPPMSANAFSSAGGGQTHNNMQPFLGVSFIIALDGIYPPGQ